MIGKDHSDRLLQPFSDSPKLALPQQEQCSLLSTKQPRTASATAWALSNTKSDQGQSETLALDDPDCEACSFLNTSADPYRNLGRGCWCGGPWCLHAAPRVPADTEPAHLSESTMKSLQRSSTATLKATPPPRPSNQVLKSDAYMIF